MTSDVLIIGAGLAGLSCANALIQSGVATIVLEAEKEIGGRARTDHIDGYLLDRGFQVFPTAYPEAKRSLNYDTLNLQRFYPGALVRFRGQFHRMADPFRYPTHALGSLTNPIGTFSDKFRVAGWRRRVLSNSLSELFDGPETTTLEHLQGMGFSRSMIDRFFRPFFGGVFMDQRLKTSSRLADFLFRMFASDDIALPERGIGSLAQQLANPLQSEQIRTGAKVLKIQGTTLTLASGEILTARHIVIATEGNAATNLVPDFISRHSHPTTCLYFSMPEPPITGPYLILNGEQEGIINSICILTEIARSYAPHGMHLLSVTTRETGEYSKDNIQLAVLDQLANWFGLQVKVWRHIQTYQISHAQPDQSPPCPFSLTSSLKIRDGLYICGDHCATSTFDGAIGSGRRAAEEIFKELST